MDKLLLYPETWPFDIGGRPCRSLASVNGSHGAASACRRSGGRSSRRVAVDLLREARFRAMAPEDAAVAWLQQGVLASA